MFFGLRGLETTFKFSQTKKMVFANLLRQKLFILLPCKAQSGLFLGLGCSEDEYLQFFSEVNVERNYIKVILSQNQP